MFLIKRLNNYSIAVVIVVALLLAGVTALFWAESPPSFERVKAQFQPSDAQLLDRNGRVIHELRVELSFCALETRWAFSPKQRRHAGQEDRNDDDYGNGIII